MRMSKITISNEAYEILENMEAGDRKVLIKEIIPSVIIQGYGLYGCGIAKNEGKAFIWYESGDSCD